MIKLRELIGYPNLDWHVKNNKSLSENIYRYSSKSFLTLFSEARQALLEGSLILSEEDTQLIKETDIGLYGVYEGIEVPLDLPFEDIAIEEAKYQGKKVSLNKPKRGGTKKFYVYTKNPKTGKVIKVSFGAEGGGQNLAVKFKEPGARASFAARHQCSKKNDKTKPGYWSCRLPRYWKQLGGDKNYSGFW
jgi:hypothetical protein